MRSGHRIGRHKEERVVASKMAQANRWTFGRVGALAALAALAIVLAGVGPAAAQTYEGEASIDPRLGVAFPVGDLAETHSVGFSGGLGISYKFHPHIAVRGDFDISVLDDESPQFGVVLAPTLTMIHYGAGLEFDFPPPDYQDFPLTFRWNVGAGGTSMSASRDFPAGEDVDFSATYPSVNSGIKIGYSVTPSVDIFLGGQMHLIFADSEEIVELVKRSSVEPYGTVWSAPVTLGVKAAFQ